MIWRPVGLFPGAAQTACPSSIPRSHNRLILCHLSTRSWGWAPVAGAGKGLLGGPVGFEFVQIGQRG